MILVDSSVFIDHFRASNAILSQALEGEQVMMHPFVIGELALGTLKHRNETIALLQDLPEALVAEADEVLFYIQRHHLYNLGIGYVDVHLLVSATLSTAKLWTHDKPLHKIARDLNLAY